MSIEVVEKVSVSSELIRVTVRWRDGRDGRDGRGERSDRTLWSSGHQRKQTKCVLCGAVQIKGVVTFRPLTNRAYRAARICTLCAI